MKIAMLPDDVRAAYERDVLDVPGTTAKAAQAWLAARGVRVSLAAVTRHRSRRVQDAPRRAHAAAAAGLVEALAGEQGLTPEDLAAGASLRTGLRLFQELRRAFDEACHDDALVPPDRIIALATALRARIRIAEMNPPVPPSRSRSAGSASDRSGAPDPRSGQ
jgi:hypothetical protein